MSSLAIPEPAKIPDEVWNIKIATTIPTMVTDNRIKTILYKFVRLTVQIGCRIALSSDTLDDIHLFEYATNEIR